MKAIKYIIISLLLAVLAACQAEESPVSGGDGVAEGTPISIVTGASLPELNFASPSRAMDDQPTIDDLRNVLKINLFVFDPSGVMLQFIGPEDISIVNIDEATKRVYFKVSNIYSSSRPRRLHFVITSAEDLHQVSGGEYITAMASETTTMPALTVSDGIDAYWCIHEVDQITENMSLTVNLIRNFVKISVDYTGSSSDFRLLGYTVVNRPNRGTIAPYIYRDHLFASFFNLDNSLISYDDIIAQGYYGVNPAGGEDTMTHTTEAEVSSALAESETRLGTGSDSPCYIYERSQSSVTSAGSDVMVTYVIVSGEYKGKKCYYKIDIGHDKDGKFGFYDLLRNFQYTLDITEVGGEGSPTLIDAMNGAANNNLSASVVTRDLFSIGYDGEKIEVSSTRVIFTEQTNEFALRFRYTTPSGMTFDPSLLKIFDVDHEDVEFDVSGVTTTQSKTISLEGSVIDGARLTRDSEGWYNLVISTKSTPADSRRLEQNIRIYYHGGTGGLGRTVTFMLRRPWEFPAATATDPGTGLSSEFEVAFTVPSGLSQTQFPLTITFESDKQNIYALNGSNLTVATGRSGFAGATTDGIILYEWRLEWADYNAGGKTYTARFAMNTTAAEDRAYNTAGIDAATNSGRDANNGTNSFSLRISHRGRKYIEPRILNITRR